MRLHEVNPFSVPASAYDVAWRASREEWLADYAPKEYKRYKSVSRACGSLFLSALRPEVISYVIRDDMERARGIGRLLLNEAVVHPRIGPVKGAFMDYWLDERASDTMHAYVPRALLIEASVKKLGMIADPRDGLSHQPRYGSLPVFATIPTDYSYNFGIRSHMVAMGEPAELEHEGRDRYDIARQGQMAQVFVNEHILLK